MGIIILVRVGRERREDGDLMTSLFLSLFRSPSSLDDVNFDADNHKTISRVIIMMITLLNHLLYSTFDEFSISIIDFDL